MATSENTKYAIVLLAPEDTPDGRGRLLHAFTTASDLDAAGVEVEFYFDGIGVECLSAFDAKENPFSQHYVELFDQVRSYSKACGVCCNHFEAVGAADALGIEMTSFDSHRSLAPFLLQGYNVLTF